MTILMCSFLGHLPHSRHGNLDPAMLPLILLCVAVICLAASPAPSVQGWIAIVLAVVALLAVCLRWSPI